MIYSVRLPVAELLLSGYAVLLVLVCLLAVGMKKSATR